MFGDLRVSRFFQNGEEEGQCGRCVVSSFAPPSLSLLEFWVCWCRLPSFDLYPLSRNLSFISLFSSDRIRLEFLCFLPWRSRIDRKITFNYFYFWQISSTFRDALILCAETPFLHFEESLSTDNIWWMLSWTLVAIIILCVRYIRKRYLSIIKHNRIHLFTLSATYWLSLLH